MKRDIRINYGVLEDITDDMRKYRDALHIMTDVIKTVNSELENNKGKSIEELKKLSKSIYKDIDRCKDELNSLYRIFSGYCNDMQSIISPINKSKLMQVDRNDIWFNMKQIKNSCTSIKNLSKAGKSSIGYSYLTKNKEKIQNEKNNYNKMKEIWSAINKYGGRINTAYSDIERIYNKKIVSYENMDDTYAKKAKTLYSKYTNTFEALRSIAITTGKNIISPVKGLVVGLWDTVVGIEGLVIGTGKLVVMEAGALIGVAVDKITGKVPKWLKYCMDKSNQYNDMIGAVLKDPGIIVEGIGQDISDKIEEEGIVYSTGYIVGSLLGFKGLDKLGKVAKASKAAKKAKGIEKISKADDVANVDGVYKSLLGQMSAEEAKLYGKFLEQGSTAGLTAVEKEALAKVESKIALSKVNGNEILELRKNVFSDIDDVGKSGIDGVSDPELKLISEYANNDVFGKSVNFNAGEGGTGITYKVFQRNDIDWEMVRSTGAKKGRGLTNAEAAEKYGLAPILDADGNVATLHHSQQNSVGPLFEASTRYHNISNAKRAPLHPYKGQLNPFNPMSEEVRKAFQKVDSIEYWKTRGRDVMKGVK